MWINEQLRASWSERETERESSQNKFNGENAALVQKLVGKLVLIIFP